MNDEIISYLLDLEANNNRDWYHRHKEQNRAALSEFEELIRAVMLKIGEFDDSIFHNEPRNLTFKLVRDTRFSHDKTPYNPTFRCHIAAKGKLPIPTGYFLSIRPNNRSFLGGGLFADMFKDATLRIRKYISANPEEFLEIICNPAFTNNFTVKGTTLKNVPKGYPTESPVAEYLKHKSWYIEYPFADTALEDHAAFASFAAKKYLIMKPFNDFLNRALIGFAMPRR